MKRLVSCLLAMLMVLSLAACSKQAADRYCTNCGHGLTKDVSFCDECGAAVGGATQSSVDGTDKTTSTSIESSTATTMTTTKSETTTTTKKSTTTTKSTAKQTTTAKSHTHSYTKKVTPATCTEKGYTTYTCSCGHSYKDNYTNPSHKYENYVCKSCGAVDKAHAYEYLMEWAKKNGEVDGSSVFCEEWIGGTRYSLTYTAQNDYMYIIATEKKNEAFIIRYLTLDDFFYTVEGDGYGKLDGYLKASQHTSSSPIAYSEYTGSDDLKYDWIELSRLGINDLLTWFKGYLNENNVGITIADLGFTSYQ